MGFAASGTASDRNSLLRKKALLYKVRTQRRHDPLWVIPIEPPSLRGVSRLSADQLLSYAVALPSLSTPLPH